MTSSTENKTVNKNNSESYENTEIGVMPVSWQVEAIGNLFDVKQGKQLSSKETKENKKLYPFLRTSNIMWGYLNLSTIDGMYFSDEEIEKLKLKDGDILVCEGGDIGRTAMFEGQIQNCAYQNHLHRLRPKEDNINRKFFVFWMNYAIKSRGFYVYTANRTTIPNLSSSRLKNFKIPLPPLPEQKKIAAVLSAVQEAKEKTEAVIEATKTLKKSMMKHLFTYGPVDIKETENIELEKTEIGYISKDWKIDKLKNLVNFKNGINFTKEQKGKTGVPTIDVFNMYNQSIYPNLNNLYRVNKKINSEYYLENNDLLFVRSSLKREGVGWTSLYKQSKEPISYCGFIIRARLKEGIKNIFPEYLTYFLRTEKARENLISVSGKLAITNINQGMLGEVLVPVPKISVQKKVAKILLELDSKIYSEENKKQALEKLFQSLLKNLMTGKQRVNNIDIPL